MKIYRAIGLTLTFVILSFTSSYPQAFQDAGAGLAGLGRSDAEWGDYDKDGDLDVLLSGLGQNDERFTYIYANDGGEFTDTGSGLPGMKEVHADWGDFDNDGDLDLAISGNTADGDRAYIFRNDDGVFIDIEAGLPMVSDGAVKWGDFDNDNDLDLFISGNWIAKVFRNDGGIFNDTGQEFGFWASTAMAWGDHDNDGDLDILLTGDSGAGAKSSIFENDNGVFIDTEILLGGLMAGTAHWIDMDNDGDLDISLSGYNDALEARFYLYENNGGGSFDPYFGGIEGVALGAVDWGDFDNDGDLDMIMSGKATGCGAFVAGIYRNDFPFFYKIGNSFTMLFRGAARWADYDNDGDLDFIITGLTASETPASKNYRNTDGMNFFHQNTKPQAPALVAAEVDGNAVNFTWTKGSDDETPADGLYYNIRLGTTESGCEVLSCMSDPETGSLKIMSIGNANQDTSWFLKDLDPGTYYYSVQTIDQGYEGSLFSPVQTFEVIATGVGDRVVKNSSKVWPNPAVDFIHIDPPSDARVSITDLKGSEILAGEIKDHGKIDVSGLLKGVYLVRIESRNKTEVIKLIKQ